MIPLSQTANGVLVKNVLRNLEILHKGILLQNKNILALQPKPSQKALP